MLPAAPGGWGLATRKEDCPCTCSSLPPPPPPARVALGGEPAWCGGGCGCGGRRRGGAAWEGASTAASALVASASLSGAAAMFILMRYSARCRFEAPAVGSSPATEAANAAAAARQSRQRHRPPAADPVSGSQRKQTSMSSPAASRPKQTSHVPRVGASMLVTAWPHSRQHGSLLGAPPSHRRSCAAAAASFSSRRTCGNRRRGSAGGARAASAEPAAHASGVSRRA